MFSKHFYSSCLYIHHPVHHYTPKPDIFLQDPAIADWAEQYRQRKGECYSTVDQRNQELPELGLDQQLLNPMGISLGIDYLMPPDVATIVARLYNDHMKDICQAIYEETRDETGIYYSVENNTLGEAALVSISELGEENIKGIFLSEPAKTGHTRRYRKGFTTTNKSKLAVCAKFKNMLESKKITICSNNLISELKTFVSRGDSFAAKDGETDDLVMSMLLAVRMIQVLQNFDADLDKKLRANVDDEFIEPMPFILLR